MSCVAPEARDFDDTVARPPRARAPRVEVVEDLDDTVTLQRDGRTRLPVAPPTAPVVTPPVALVEPVRSAPLLPDLPASATDVTDNPWSQPLPDAPRPFRLRLADGTLLPLDQPVFLGRKPSVPRIHPGGTPLLVTFDSPLREVSSTHLELTTVGGAIVATDLKSTNGSVLRVPGTAPRTLIGGQSAVVTPGTVIELGDGNVIELLAPDPDAAPPDSSGARP
jgi:hypothetical protein